MINRRNPTWENEGDIQHIQVISSAEYHDDPTSSIFNLFLKQN